jgi:hypothetical protein
LAFLLLSQKDRRAENCLLHTEAYAPLTEPTVSAKAHRFCAAAGFIHLLKYQALPMKHRPEHWRCTNHGDFRAISFRVVPFRLEPFLPKAVHSPTLYIVDTLFISPFRIQTGGQPALAK